MGVALAGYNPNAQNSRHPVLGGRGDAGRHGGRHGWQGCPAGWGGAMQLAAPAPAWAPTWRRPVPGCDGRLPSGSPAAACWAGLWDGGGGGPKPVSTRARSVLDARRSLRPSFPRLSLCHRRIRVRALPLAPADRPALSIRLLSPSPDAFHPSLRACSRLRRDGHRLRTEVWAPTPRSCCGSAVIHGRRRCPCDDGGGQRAVPGAPAELGVPQTSVRGGFRSCGAPWPIESVKIVPAKGQVPSQLSLPL